MGFKAVVITVSDRGARGERHDESGPEIVESKIGRDFSLFGDTSTS